MTVFRPYPKIPRYDHPAVNPDLYQSSDLDVFEKYDGSNLKFIVFDRRYAHKYPDRILDLDPAHGDIVFGGRRSIRGVVEPPFEAFDGNFKRALRVLADVDPDPLLNRHEEWGPITVYAENLVYHSIDYGYRDDPPPPLIGFDAYAASRDSRSEIPTDPFDDGFEGFLPYDRVETIVTDLGIPKARRLDFSPPVTPSSLPIPESHIGPVEAEGTVFRSDSMAARAKIVSEAHREANRRIFGGNTEDAETGAEYLVAKYCTPARIRKQIHKLVIEEGREFGLHLNDELYPRVVKDMWREEWPEIMKLDQPIIPGDVYPLVAKLCIEQLRQMELNAELNDVDPFDLWRAMWDPETDVGTSRDT